MDNIESMKSRFLPLKEGSSVKKSRPPLYRNGKSRKAELDRIAKNHTKVSIPKAVKDFGRIKRVVDASPNPDNTEKISQLKREIHQKSYHIDDDALAKKIFAQEF